jgi:hypothetical protein
MEGRAVLPAQAGAPEISGALRTATASDEEPAGPDDESPELALPAMDNVDADVAGSDVEPRGAGEFDPPTGDYWMPVPESAYADLDSAGYGCPSRTDRDRAVESEPTAVVPTWPPARPFDRIELPRTWSDGSGRKPRALREATGRRWDEADRNVSRRRGPHPDEEAADRYWDQLDRDGRDGWRRNHGPEDERLALRAVEPPRRPRPRPNPTVYVSRHAAE